MLTVKSHDCCEECCLNVECISVVLDHPDYDSGYMKVCSNCALQVAAELIQCIRVPTDAQITVDTYAKVVQNNNFLREKIDQTIKEKEWAQDQYKKLEEAIEKLGVEISGVDDTIGHYAMGENW